MRNPTHPHTQARRMLPCMSIPANHRHAIVIGTGFGGLGAALRLAERGLRPLVLEAMKIPGGCASTFTRRGRSYEAGATLFAGLGPGGVLREWIDSHDLDVAIDLPDLVMELRTPSFSLTVPRERQILIEELCRLEPAHAQQIHAFFRMQGRVADFVWDTLRPELVPPLGLRGLWGHLKRTRRYLELAPLVGRSLAHVLERYGLDEVPAVRTFCDEVAQITVQCDAATAEAPFALATLDYFARGAGHVHGGIGRLADAIVGRVDELGGEVRFGHRVVSLERSGSWWSVLTPRGRHHARHVFANMLPDAVESLTGRTRRMPGVQAVRSGWSACMLYLATEDLPTPSPRHLALVGDENQPLEAGNHVFCSIGDLVDGERTVTVSTHVDMAEFLSLSPDERGRRAAEIQETMRRTIRLRAPEIAATTVDEMTASPRTFERFTCRKDGFVGGVPRRRGLRAYGGLLRRPRRDGLHLVGDSHLPGQSVLATALGGAAAAAAIEAPDTENGSPVVKESPTGDMITV